MDPFDLKGRYAVVIGAGSPAENFVYHDRLCQSRLMLPVMLIWTWSRSGRMRCSSDVLSALASDRRAPRARRDAPTNCGSGAPGGLSLRR
jgi:hypothetical protein